MQSKLRKSVIRLEGGRELFFQKVMKYNKFGCKAIFFDPNTNRNYDITVVSKSLLHLNSYRQQFEKNIKKYQKMKSNHISQIVSATEDGDIIYIISQAEKYRLSQLVKKRDGLTEFQAIYFCLRIMNVISYVKPGFFQALELDQIYLTQKMSISIPFSVWLAFSDTNKHLPLRHQDFRNALCPEILENAKYFSIDQINSWNIGIFLYQLCENRKPFTNKEQLKFTKSPSKQLNNLISKLLERNPKQRLKYQLLPVQPLFKNYRSVPHILPQTIFYCPPSYGEIQEYEHPVAEQEDLQKIFLEKKNVLTSHKLDSIQFNEGKRDVKTVKQIKPSERNLTQSQSYIYDFVDISHVYGYGYQMNTGIICFVFNDRSSMYFQDQSKKKVFYLNDKKQMTEYQYQKLPQESQIKKKLFVLQAYTKSIKKFKQKPSVCEQVVTVCQYFRAHYCAIFLLTNSNIQICFNDKFSFLLAKYNIYVQMKNSDKFEPYQMIPQNYEIQVRKKYALIIAERLFHWDVQCLRGINGKILKSKGDIQEIEQVDL